MTLALNPSDVLYDYVRTTATGVDETDRIMALAPVVLDLCADMAADYSALFPLWANADAYYRGDPPMPRQPDRLTRKYRELLDMSRSNWCALVVDVVNERLKIGAIQSTRNPVQDKNAWQWWQDNNMDGVSPQIHSAALRYGMCYVSVWPREGRSPRIMGEPPTMTHVRYNPETDEPFAAFRVWADYNCGCVHVDLTMVDYQFHLTAHDALRDVVPEDVSALGIKVPTVDLTDLRWEFRVEGDVVPFTVNPLGEVPYRRMLTKPDLTGGFSSELDGLYPIQDRIIRTNFDRLMAQSFASFPRAWVTGIDVPRDPKTGQPREPFDAAVDRLWTIENENARVGQLDAAELNGYLDANTADVQAMATQSRTPPHYLIAGMGQFPSGESVRATEYGLTRKVEARQQSYGDTWSDVLRLTGKAAGNNRLANDQGLNVVWSDVEARSEGEVVDALIKMGTLGVPWPSLWQRWGATPEEIEAWRAELDRSQILANALAREVQTPTTQRGNGQRAQVVPPVVVPPISGSTNAAGETTAE